MAILEIPVTADLDRYSQQVTIDEVDYRLLIAYNTRMARWVLSVFTTEGTELATGIPLVTGQPLFQRWGGVGELPRDGFVMLIDGTGDDAEPVKESIGDTHRLLYIPLEDI